MATILITGGAGFIGSKLTQRLLGAGHAVRVLDLLAAQIHGPAARAPAWTKSEGVEFIRSSVTNRESLAAAIRGVDAIVHLAAETGTGQSMYEIARYNEVNTQGTALLLDTLVGSPGHTVKRIVLASSRSIYGEGAYLSERGDRVFPGARSAEALARQQWEPTDVDTGRPLKAVPTRETDPPRPASIYAATKYAQEDLVRIACEAARIGYAILRLQNVYGEGQSLNNPYTGILSIFSTRIRLGKVLPLFEDGEESRDFVHVDDVVSAIERCLTIEQSPNTTINVGSGVATSVRAVAEGLSSALGRPLNITITGDYRIGDIRHNWADISRLHAILSLQPRVSLSEGLKRFAAWVEEQPLPEDRLDHANAELKARNLMSR